MGDKLSDHPNKTGLSGKRHRQVPGHMYTSRKESQYKQKGNEKKPENTKTQKKSSDRSKGVIKDSCIVKLSTLSQYRKRTKRKRQALLVLQGDVFCRRAANPSCRFLVDSGSEEVAT